MTAEKAAQHILGEMAKGRSFGDVPSGGEGTREAKSKGNYNEMSSAEERRRIDDFDRKHPSLFGAGRLLLSKGETAKIYA